MANKITAVAADGISGTCKWGIYAEMEVKPKFQQTSDPSGPWMPEMITAILYHTFPSHKCCKSLAPQRIHALTVLDRSCVELQS